MNKLLIGILCCLFIIPISRGQESSAAKHILPVRDANNQARLQRGAAMFMNYCSGCHSLKYLRYNRMGMDLGLLSNGRLDEAMLKNNLIFTHAALSDPIEVAMPAEDAKQWFGIVPPDLSLVARQRGGVWLYNYLQGFYTDRTRPFAVNNLLIPDVAMPDVLEPLRGQMHRVQGINSYQLIVAKPGELSTQNFDHSIRDLVDFLDYVAEPAQLVRYQIGFYVLVFLSLLLGLAYCLKRNYWRKLL